MKKALHILALTAVAAAIFALPYRVFIGPIRLGALFGGGGVDAVTSPSIILDAPDGSYVVLLNEARHQKYRTAQDWADFLSGESLVIMDDVACAVIDTDAGGIEMAESYRSRLPENQMKITRMDGLMLMSRAQYGAFDVIVLSRAYADAMQASTVYGLEDVRVIEVGGAA